MCHLCWIYSCAFLCALIFLVLFVFYHFIDVIFYLIFYSVHLFSYFAAKMSNKFFCSVCSETLSQRSLSWRNMVNAYKLLIIMPCIKLTNKVLTCKTCELRCFCTLAPFCSLSGDKLILLSACCGADHIYRASAYGTPLDGATVKVVITTVNKT